MGMDSIGEYIQRMSIRQISILMGIVTIIAPIFMTSFPVREDGVVVDIGFILVALTWTYSSSHQYLFEGIQFLNPTLIIPGLLVTGPPLLHAILVIRYCQGKNTSREVLMVGILSVALPVIVGLTPMVSFFMSYGIFTYTGIISIQLILGYWIMRSHGSPLDGLQWDDEQDASKHVITWWMG